MGLFKTLCWALIFLTKYECLDNLVLPLLKSPLLWVFLKLYAGH